MKDLCTNDTNGGRRPNYDEIAIVKTLFLQSIYNIVYESKKAEIYDSILFINFLEYQKSVSNLNAICPKGEAVKDQQ